MKNVKKTLLIVLIILMIVIALLLVRELFLWSNGKLDKSSTMNKEEVIQLLEKGSTYSNYYYAPELTPKEESKTEYYIKDNIVACYLDSKLLRWTDYNTGEEITFSNSEASISHNAKLVDNEQYSYDYSTLVNSDQFEYLGEQNDDGRKVIIAQIKDDINKNVTIKFYIDKETGIILKRTDYTKHFLWTEKLSNDRNVKLNVVTAENIAKPDLSNYKIVENK